MFIYFREGQRGPDWRNSIQLLSVYFLNIRVSQLTKCLAGQIWPWAIVWRPLPKTCPETAIDLQCSCYKSLKMRKNAPKVNGEPPKSITPENFSGHIPGLGRSWIPNSPKSVKHLTPNSPISETLLPRLNLIRSCWWFCFQIKMQQIQNTTLSILYTPFRSVLRCQLMCKCRVGVWWLFGRFIAFRLRSHRFKSCSSCLIGTLGKSFTSSCLWCFSVKLRHSILAVLGAPLSSSVLEEALQK